MAIDDNGFQAEPAQLKNFHVGDKVTFKFRMEGNVTKILSLIKL